MPRVFDDYKRKAGFRQAAGLVVSTAFAFGAGALAGLLLGGPVGALTFWAVLLAAIYQRCILAGNSELRAGVADKLRGHGLSVDTGADRFVGLAYPCFFNTARRMVETDDDVGFLSVDDDGLTFLGDGAEFHIPAEHILAVRIRRDPQCGWLSRRVEVDTADGEPLETVVFDSRDRWLHGACNADNDALYRQLRAIMRPEQAARRLAEAELERDQQLDA